MERHAPDEQSSIPNSLKARSDREHVFMGNLPAPLASLIGRDQEIATVRALLQRDDIRLITLTGAGGVGKTQLALAISRHMTAVFTNGIFFVPLASIRDADFVAMAIAQELDVPKSGSRPLVDELMATLRDQHLLVVLDNFEHVLSSATLMVDLLTACPDVKVMVTSRAPLRVSGEHVFTVTPLELPAADQSVAIDGLTHYAAIKLFVTRAQEARPEFAITESNATAIAEICRRIDGLPLAIELAAAQLRVLSPRQLLTRMSNNLPLPVGGLYDAPARLQTMRQAIAWSYDLLTLNEQALFRRLAIFVGGFTLEAAEAVTVDSLNLDDLTSLVDSSCVQQAEQRDGDTRFVMLETIREFGLDKLEANGESAMVQARQAAFCLACAEHADQGYRIDHKRIWGERIETELPNMRVALAWAEDQNEAELMLRLALALWWFWANRGLQEETDTWLSRTVTATMAVPSELYGSRVHLLVCAARCALQHGDCDRAATLADEASSLANESGDVWATVRAARIQGLLAIWRGDLDHAKSCLTDALAQWRELEPGRQFGGPHYDLGFLASLQKNYQEAESWFAELLVVAQAQSWPLWTADALEALGTCAREQGDLARAVPQLAEALALAIDDTNLATIANCLKSLGAVAAATGRPEQAARLFGAFDSIREHGSWIEPPAEIERREHTYDTARAQLSAEKFAEFWLEGRELSLDQAIAGAFEVARDFTVTPTPRRDTSGLTPRELDVLRLLIEGLTDKEIAEVLDVSRRTASKHVEMILAKFDVSSRTAAATYATRHGIG